MHRILIVFALLLPFAQACTSDLASKPKPNSGVKSNGDLLFEATGPVAVVDGKVISASDFNERSYRFTMAARGRLPYLMYNKSKNNVLKELIDDSIFDVVIERQKIIVSDAELELGFEVDLQTFAKRYANDDLFMGHYKRQGLSLDDVKADMRKRLAQKKLIQSMLNVTNTKTRVEEFYKKNINDYKEGPKAQARHIRFGFPVGANSQEMEIALGKAKIVEKKARAKDADFAALVAEFSEEPSKSRDKEPEFLEHKNTSSVIADTVFKLKVGEISKPVKTSIGYYIVKVEAVKNARTVPLEEVNAQILKSLEDELVQQRRKAFLNTERKALGVKTFKENIKVNNPSRLGRVAGQVIR